MSRKNLYVGMVKVFLGCTRACVCRCDGDVICVDHDQNSAGGVYSVNSVGERTPPCGTTVLN